MKVTLDKQTIESINIFQNMTGSSVIDCINEEDEIYFVVAEGQYGLSVGKGGSKIRNAENVFKKDIRVFEYSADLEKFIRNMIPDVQEISIKERYVEIKIKPSDKPRVIGKTGKNIKLMNKMLSRLFGIETLKVK